MTAKRIIFFKRRQFLTNAAAWLIAPTAVRTVAVAAYLPWRPNAGDPPMAVVSGPWQFFTAAEVAAMEALSDRIIPPDAQFPGGRDAGCTVFIDRQLAGAYGRQQGLYVRAPFKDGAKNQGPQ